MFEVFSARSGDTLWYVKTKEEALKAVASDIGADYLPANSGYYVRANGRLTARRYDTSANAQRYCDFENMASDSVTFTWFYYQASPSDVAMRNRCGG